MQNRGFRIFNSAPILHNYAYKCIFTALFLALLFMPNQLTFSLNKAKGIIYYSFYADDGRAWYSTGLSCTEIEFKDKTYPKNVRNWLNRLTMVVDKFVSNKSNALLPVLKRDIKDLIDSEIGRKSMKSDRRKQNVLDMFKEYLLGVEKGAITYKGRKASASQIRIIKSVLKYVDKWAGGKKMINDLTVSDIKDFQNVIIGKNRTQNTLSTYNTRLLIFGRTTRELGWHNAELFSTSNLNIPQDDIDHAVYFNEAELQVILKTSVSKTLERTRDMFVLGCQCGLRFSDLSQIAPLNVKDGFITIQQQKTEAVVMLPINSIARGILKKYNNAYSGPKERAAFAEGVQKIIKKAEYKELTFWSRSQGGKNITGYKPRYELANTHTMRRSFATNAYLAGVQTDLIMAITGHKTVKSFTKYIRISLQEKAALAAEHPFFK